MNPAPLVFLAPTLLCLAFLTWPSAAALVLVPSGATWRYLDAGSDQGIAWRYPAFNDDGWPSGAAELGYGDGDEATVINGGPANNRIITTYFRHRFDVANRASITNLAVRLLCDDGGVVYLNGAEIFRRNMPEGTLSYTSRAAAALGTPQEQTFFDAAVPPSALLSGPNLLAVEIHQADTTSTDVSFNLELVANSPQGNLPPQVRFTAPRNGAEFSLSQIIDLLAQSTDTDGVVEQMQLFEGSTLRATSTNGSLAFSWQPAAIGVYTFTVRATDQLGASSTSAPLRLAVTSPQMDVALFPDFSSRQGLILQGAANYFRETLQLNPAQGGVGGAWLHRPFYLQEGFETEFQFRIAEVSGAGADGFAFVIQGNIYPRLGWAGYSIGYGGVPNSLAVEFDTYRNSEAVEPNNNHISIQTRGTNPNSGQQNASLAITTSIPNLSDGTLYTAKVRYQQGVLTVFFGDNPDPLLTAPVDLDTLLALDSGMAWVGFTSSTGGDTELHAIHSWWITAARPAVTVELASPEPNAFQTAPAQWRLAACAASSHGPIRRVEFFQEGLSLGVITNEPFEMIWSAALPGRYALTALATDDGNHQARSQPVTVHLLNRPGDPLLLIPRGASWHFLDDGSDQGTEWRMPAFDQHFWPAGPAQLGYGDSDELTVIRGGPSNARFITTYFRRTFYFSNPSAVLALDIHLLRDDGGVVYLNGSEIFRSGMPAGEIRATTYASTTASGDDETMNFYSMSVPPQLLRPGANLVAVEIHQADRTSSDLSFDLELVARALEAPRPTVRWRVDGEVQLSFSTMLNRRYTIQYSKDLINWLDVSPVLTGTGGTLEWLDAGPPATVSLPGAVGARFYRLLLE